MKKYSAFPWAAGTDLSYAAKAVDDQVLEALKKLAEEAQLTEKFQALYNGEGDQYRRETSCSFII